MGAGTLAVGDRKKEIKSESDNSELGEKGQFQVSDSKRWTESKNQITVKVETRKSPQTVAGRGRKLV